MTPKYPVYVISKGRWENPLTAKCLMRDGVPFRLVVEEQEADAYAAAVGKERLLILPFKNLGKGSIPARNWVWDHALKDGRARHWILDDNLRTFYRRYQTQRLPVEAGIGLTACERFVDRYENVAISGLNYHMWAFPHVKMPPFYLNGRVYSCVLIQNDIPYRWRGRYNEDADLCLQVLSGGWCTVLLNAFLVMKMASMKMGGGNTDQLYAGDGRIKMTRELQRRWPGVVKLTRRFQRSQHWVDWSKFDNQLKHRTGVNMETHSITESDMQMVQNRPVVKNAKLKAMLKHDKARAAR